ncbi:MAG: serine hydrolase domain-containing protein [Woeseiaceae bacterium]
MSKLTRREFLYGCSAVTLPALVACDRQKPSPVDAYIAEYMQLENIAGLSVAVLRNGAVALSKGYGLANIDKQVPMTPATVQNIASVSKPITLTAVMQCVERGLIELENDANEYLPLPVRNPNFPDAPITVLQLLTHTSSIADGANYWGNYRCGDSTVPLQRWIDGYLQPDGEFYSAAENFHATPPGEAYEYNNVAFGLLSYLVQVVVDRDFDDFCRVEIFEPLGMLDTTWFVANSDKSRHAVPYLYVPDSGLEEPIWGSARLGVPNAQPLPATFTGFYPDCIYDHPNFADGFLRTSVNDASKFLRMIIGNGMSNGNRVLREQTVAQMFDRHGITWHQDSRENGPVVWGHGGSDPGVSTSLKFRPDNGDGVILFANTDGVSLGALSSYLFSVVEDLLD